MAGTYADVSRAGVSGGAGGEQPVAAEDADAEVTLWRRCQEAGVAYVAPAPARASTEQSSRRRAGTSVPRLAISGDKR